jgi:hypothetical protein
MIGRPEPKRAVPGERASTDKVDFELLTAAYNGHDAEVRAALERGADIAAQHKETGLSALHIAVGTNNLPLVKLLVEEWKAPFAVDGFGRMPTAVAAECCASEELCDYIVEKEAQALGIAE